MRQYLLFTELVGADIIIGSIDKIIYQINKRLSLKMKKGL